MESFWTSFWANLAATLIGAIFGILAALWIDRRREALTARERVEKIIRLLKDELSYNEAELDRLNGNLERVVDEIGTISSQLRVELWKAYSDGGELQWINDVVLVSLLADTYYSLRAVMTLADKYYEALYYANPGHELPMEVRRTLMQAIEYANNSVKSTIRKIDDVLKTY